MKQEQDAARLVAAVSRALDQAEVARQGDRVDRLAALWVRACRRWQRWAAYGTVFPAAVQLGLLSPRLHGLLMAGLHGCHGKPDTVAWLLPELFATSIRLQQPGDSWEDVVIRYQDALVAQVAAERAAEAAGLAEAGGGSGDGS